MHAKFHEDRLNGLEDMGKSVGGRRKEEGGGRRRRRRRRTKVIPRASALKGHLANKSKTNGKSVSFKQNSN